MGPEISVCYLLNWPLLAKVMSRGRVIACHPEAREHSEVAFSESVQSKIVPTSEAAEKRRSFLQTEVIVTSDPRSDLAHAWLPLFHEGNYRVGTTADSTRFEARHAKWKAQHLPVLVS